MQTLFGGWGDREDTVATCAQRVARSWQLMPAEPDRYGPWSVRYWIPGADSVPLTRVDINDPKAVQGAIVAHTERMNEGPRTAPGLYLQFDREGVGQTLTFETLGEYAREYEYSVRAGFFNRRRPFNHLLLDLDPASDPELFRGYLTALVHAWEPDHLSVANLDIKRAQGHRPPQVVVGWLTYLRDTMPVDVNALDQSGVTVTAADGGRYLQLPGTPLDPDSDAVAAVRRALGYPSSA